MITFPRTITIDPINRTRAAFYPIEEIETLWQPDPVRKSLVLEPNQTVQVGAGGVQLDILVTFKFKTTTPFEKKAFPPATRFGLTVFASSTNSSKATVITVETAATAGGPASVTIEHTHSSTAHFDMGLDEKDITLRVLVDRSMVEVFPMGGRAALTKRVYPSTGCGEVQLFSELSDGQIAVDAVVHEVMVAKPPALEHYFE
jgi:sucrose-6-phosphate hydrolase SacC (GH32 family)